MKKNVNKMLKIEIKIIKKQMNTQTYNYNIYNRYIILFNI